MCSESIFEGVPWGSSGLASRNSQRIEGVFLHSVADLDDLFLQGNLLNGELSALPEP